MFYTKHANISLGKWLLRNRFAVSVYWINRFQYGYKLRQYRKEKPFKNGAKTGSFCVRCRIKIVFKEKLEPTLRVLRAISPSENMRAGRHKASRSTRESSNEQTQSCGANRKSIRRPVSARADLAPRRHQSN